MTAEIIQFRPWREKRDIERAYEELNKQAIEITNIALGFVDYSREVSGQLSGIDPSQANAFHAPESDPV